MPSVKRSRPATATGETDTGDSEDETAALPQTLTEAQVGILTDKVDRCLRWNSFLTHCYIDSGRWYMQSIFVNLSLATWRWILKGKIPKGADRDHLLDAYDALALNPKHDDIVLDDFCQLTQRYRNQRERKKRDFSQFNSEFVDVDEMPSKMIPRTFADRRLRPIDDIDNDIDNELDSEEDEPEFELNRILAG
jgi:hypothetical protein